MIKRRTDFHRFTMAMMMAMGCVAILSADAFAVVVSRGSSTANSSAATRPSAVRGNTAVGTRGASTTTPAAPVANDAVTDADASADPKWDIEDKSATFGRMIDASGMDDVSDNELAERIRLARDAANNAAKLNMSDNLRTTNGAGGVNACDTELRSCMTGTCGDGFVKCAGDRDQDWNNKMNSCRLKTKCAGDEYTAFAAEIKADRDAAAYMAEYNAIVDCGNRYNQCIESQCGKDFSKCLGKSKGDFAINSCKKVAEECREQDSGLGARAMGVFGTLRQNAEELVQEDEKRLYALRDEMADICHSMGAMFDERTFDCVFTVNLWMGTGRDVPMSSKKMYAGGTFNCNQDWFGVNMTTYIENAQRATRDQQAALSGMMGGAAGVAVGAVTSGAISRGMETWSAKQDVKKATKERDATDKAIAKEKDTATKAAKKDEASLQRDINRRNRQEEEDGTKPVGGG